MDPGCPDKEVQSVSSVPVKNSFEALAEEPVEMDFIRRESHP